MARLFSDDKCMGNLKSLNVRANELELLANDCAKWRFSEHKRLKQKVKYFKKQKKMKI